MPKLLANGLELEYDEFGSPHAPAVLLIMGLGTQMVAWSEEFCSLLADGGYRIIRFDNRDIGLSEKLHGQRTPKLLRLLLADHFKTTVTVPYTLDDLTLDALGVLDALQLEKAHIVGASMGGMIAQIMSARYPERVLSLTSIMSSSGKRRLPKPKLDVIRQMLKRPDSKDLDIQIRHAVKTFQMIGSPGYPRPEKAWYKLIKAMLERSTYPQGYYRHLAAVLSAGSRVKLLKTIDKPALVVHGADDVLVRVEHGIDTARHIPGAQLEIIEGMGHDLPPRLVPKLADLLLEHFSTV